MTRTGPAIAMMLVLTIPVPEAFATVVKIGGIAASNEDGVPRAMRLAVDKINRENLLFPSDTVELVTALDNGDGWMTARHGCDFVHDGIHAVVGPSYSSTSLKLSPLLGAMNVPFISYAATSPTLGDPVAHPFFSRVVPQDTAQAAVIVKAVQHFEWPSTCILFENSDYGTRGALETADVARAQGVQVVAMLSYDAGTANVTGVATELVAAGCRIFVHWCTSCSEAMQSARDNGLVVPGEYGWILSDGCTIQTQNGAYSTAPGLAYSMIGSICIKPEGTRPGPELSQFLQDWDTAANGEPGAYAVFAYDAVIAAAMAISATTTAGTGASSADPFSIPSTERCLKDPNTSVTEFSTGAALRDALGAVSFRGASSGSGNVTFTNNGGTTTYEPASAVYALDNLQSIGMDSGLYRKVASAEVSATGTTISFSSEMQWTPTNGGRPVAALSIQGKRLKVVVPMSPAAVAGGTSSTAPFQYVISGQSGCDQCFLPAPYLGLITTCPTNCYKGISILVLERLASQLNFTYEINHVQGGYGYTNILKRFVGGLPCPGCKNDLNLDMAGHYDVAIGDFTASAGRSEFADMSYPYYDLGLIYMSEKKAKTEETGFFDEAGRILRPFDEGLWIALLVWSVATAAVFWIYEHGVNMDIPDWGGSNDANYQYNVAGLGDGVPGSRHARKLRKQASQNRSGDHADSEAAETVPTGQGAIGDREQKLTRNTKYFGKKMKTNQWGLFNSWYWSITSFTQNPDSTPVTIPGKLLAAGFLLANVIFIAAYTANLAALLSETSKLTIDFKGYADIEAGFTGDTIQANQICMQIGGTGENFFLEKWPDKVCYNCGCDDGDERDSCVPYRTVSTSAAGMRRGPGYNATASWTLATCIDKLKTDTNCKAVQGDGPILDFHSKRDCKTRLAGDPFYTQGFSVFSKKGSYLSGELASGVLNLRRNTNVENRIPTIPDILTLDFDGGGNCDPNTLGDGEEDNDVPRLGVNQMAGAFIVSFISFLVSVVMFAYGQMVAHCHDEKVDSDHAERRATQTLVQMPSETGFGFAPAPENKDKQAPDHMRKEAKRGR